MAPSVHTPALFRSQHLYYDPSRNTVHDIIVCVSAVLIPELLVLYFLLTLPGVKYFQFSTRLFFPASILIIVMIWLFLWGRGNLAGGGSSVAAGIYYLVIRLVPLLFLVEGAERKRHNRVVLFIHTALLYFIASFIVDALLFQNYANRRQLLLLGHFEIGNSTNYINMLVLCLSCFLLLRHRLFYFYSVAVLIISFIWDNRTGLLGCTTLLAVRVFSQSKVLAIVFGLILTSYLVPLFSQTRLGEQGLGSLRWITQFHALENMMSGKFLFGGYRNIFGDTEWLHNVYLDVYRVAGVAPMFLMLLFTIYSFFYFRKSRFPYRLLCTILAILIGMSSVVFEGSHVEYLFFFIVLYNSMFILPPQLAEQGRQSNTNVTAGNNSQVLR